MSSVREAAMRLKQSMDDIYENTKNTFGCKSKVSGKSMIQLTNVNPTKHNVAVKLIADEPYVDLSTATVTRCGKNFLGKEIPTTTLANGTTIVNNGDGSLTITKKAGDLVSIYSEPFYLPKGEYAFSNGLGRDSLQGGRNLVYILIYEANDGPQVSGAVLYSVDKIVVTIAKSGYYQLRLYGPADVVPDSFTIRPQLEPGNVFTDCEKTESATHTINADGTVEGVTSITPTMWLFTDTEGVTIEAEYYPDNQHGYDAGKKSEYDAFWDSYQNYGKRTVYQYMFSGEGWNLETFRPKYNIQPTDAEGMFRNSGFGQHTDLDLDSILSGFGVTLDFSNCLWFGSTFLRSTFTKIGVLDFSAARDVSYTCHECKNLRTLGKIISNETVKYSNTFTSCTALENLTVEGTIGQNGFDVKSSTKLSKASITSIVNALSATTTGLTVTLSLAAVNTAFETNSGANDGSTSDEWNALKSTKSNWTISLV